jgi:FkbM family methyltransferase
VDLPLVRRVRIEELERRLAKSERAVAKTQRALEKAMRGELSSGPPTVPLEYEHAEIWLTAATKSASKRRTLADREPFTVEWIHSLPPGEVLYDIGANVGAVSLIAALRPQGPMHVIAFEPGAATFAVLCSNIVLNHAGERISPLCVMLGERTQLGRFGYSDLEAGAALHAGGGDAIPSEVAYWQPVLMFSLDDLVEGFGLPRPNRMKIDVDGAEMNVLRGAGRVLSDSGLKSILVELNASAETAIEALLEAHGLHRVETYRETEGDRRPGYARFERS